MSPNIQQVGMSQPKQPSTEGNYLVRALPLNLDVDAASDARDDQPGKWLDKWMVGDDIVLVLPVLGLSNPRIYLALRFDVDGEVFAAITPTPEVRQTKPPTSS